MNTLTTPVARKPVLERAVNYRGFARDDGLWEVEGHMRDTRDLPELRLGRPDLPPGEPAHDMTVRVTYDAALTVVDIEAVMDATPFDECQRAVPPMTGLIGATMGRGWRKAIEHAIGGVGGCTHLRELLFNLATPAIHTHTLHQRRQPGVDLAASSTQTTAPAFVGRCISWRRDGPVVERTYPQFFLRADARATDAD